MSDFDVKVFGSSECGPCQSLKRDLEALSKLFDIDFEYFDITGEGLSGIPDEFQEMAKKYADDKSMSVPFYVVSSECGRESNVGGNINNLLDTLAGIKCEEESDEVPKVREEAG